MQDVRARASATRMRVELKKMLDKIARKTRPFAVIPKDPGLRRAVWVEPKLVGEVAFSEWTDENIIRHPSFQGLRQDKKPQEVVREEPLILQSRDHPWLNTIQRNPVSWIRQTGIFSDSGINSCSTSLLTPQQALPAVQKQRASRRSPIDQSRYFVRELIQCAAGDEGHVWRSISSKGLEMMDAARPSWFKASRRRRISSATIRSMSLADRGARGGRE